MSVRRNVSKGASVTIGGARRRLLAVRRRSLALMLAVSTTDAEDAAQIVGIMPAMEPQHIYVFKRVFAPEYKIGISSDVAHRIQAVSIQNACSLTLVLEYPGTRRDEAELHRRFQADRLRGEWFRESPALLAWIREQCSHKEAK